MVVHSEKAYRFFLILKLKILDVRGSKYSQVATWFNNNVWWKHFSAGNFYSVNHYGMQELIMSMLA